MQDQEKTKEQLIDELNKMRRKVAEFEAAEGKSLGPGKILRQSEGLREIEKNLSGKQPNILSPDDEIEQDEFAKVVDIPQIQSLMDDFYKLTNIGIAILDLKGNILVANGWHDICTKFHRVHPETLKNCLESDVYLTENVREGEYLLYKCKNNMWDVVTPIFMGGKHVGNVFYGQFLFEDEAPDSDLFAAQAERYGFDKSEYLAALQRVLRWSKEKTADLMRFYSKLASMIGQLSHSNLKLRKTLIESKMVADALRESEEKYRNLVESISDVIFEIDGRGALTYVSPAVRNVFGYEAEDFVGKTFLEFVHPEDSGFLIKRFAELTKGVAYPLEYRVVGKSGAVHHVRTHTKPIMKENTFEGARGTLIDITERKRTDEALRQSENKFSKTFFLSPDAMAITRLADGVYVSVNESFREILGYAEEEVIGKTSLEINIWENPEDGKKLIEGLKADGAVTNFEARLLAKNGDIRCGLISAAIVVLNGVEHILNIARDITERKRFEDDLQKSEEQLRDSDEKTRLLVEQSPVGIAIFQDGKYRYANPELLRIFGCESDDQILGEQMIRFVAPGHQRLFIERCKRHIEGKSGRPSYQVEGIKRNGELFDMVLWPKKVDYEGQPAILAFVMDVTETRNLRNQLTRAQKMEAIGTLAGGIAHDFNNLLQVILGYSELMIMNPALPDQFSRGVKAINKVAVNGADLVRRVLTFARKTENEATPLNLNDKITQTSELLRRTIPKMIQIELKLSKKPTLIKADPSQIEQIIMNLAVNADHAMPEGGNLTIETQTVNIDKAYCLDHVEAIPGQYILLSVSDTGHGIDRKTMERIFEPFFTTKGPGIGTGLGLSMVYGIVKQHGGHITCYSEPGVGATFRIYFPEIVSEVKSEKPMDLAVPKGGTETILLVDDNESVRDVGREMLIEYGYRVITASNGREALEIYSAERESISLVILDLFMPEMGGKECLRALLRMDPQVRVLLVSGFTQNGEISDALDSGAKGFVRKPVDISKFLEKIRKIIDED